MKIAGVDFTGIAYLAVLAIGGVAVYMLVSKAGAVGSSLADAAAALKAAGGKALDTVTTAVNPADPGNLAYTAASGAVSGVLGRDSSPGSLLADWFPSVAEKQVNTMFNGPTAPGDYYPDDLPMPAFVGTIPDDPAQAAIFYRRMH